MSPIASLDLAWPWALACLALLLFGPGLAALRLAGEPSRGATRLALALGCSITLLPLALLWSDRLGLRWSGPRVWAGLLACGLALLPWRFGPDRREARPPDARHRASPTSIALTALLLIAGASRYQQARDLVVAPWVDGYHHTLVTALLVAAGGLPNDYRPFLEVGPFYYHFGFHSLAACLVWMGATPIPVSVLVIGQAISALAALATYALARRCLDRRLAAVLAAALPATLFWLPAYYLSWSRFTQLAGLVALPTAWLLLRDAMRCGARPRRWLLAAAVCAGLSLVHVRVMAFFAVGALVLALERLPAALRVLGARRVSVDDRPAWRSADSGLADLIRLGGIALLSLLLASPWLLGNLAAGISTMAATSSDWILGSPDIQSRVAEAPPAWLFTWSSNGLWIRLALIGLGAGLLARRRSAFGIAAVLAGCLVLVAPQAFGVSASWLLPPFALAISLWLPVALGLGLLADLMLQADEASDRRPASEPGSAALRRALPRLRIARALCVILAVGIAWQHRGTAWPWLDPPEALLTYVLSMGVLAYRPASRAPRDERAPGSSDPGRLAIGLEAVAVLAILGLAAAGAWRMREIVRSETVLALPADIEAAAWVRRRVPSDDRLLIGATNWHLGTWRGIDGGYWLPVLADRQTSLPAALYSYGDAALIASVNEVAEATSQGDALDDAQLTALLDRARARWIYLGPASLGRPEAFSVARLRRHPELVERYDRDGVHIFERRGP